MDETLIDHQSDESGRSETLYAHSLSKADTHQLAPRLLDYFDQARAEALSQGCCRRCCHIPVVFDLIYDRVRSREVAVLTLTVFLIGLFMSAIVGNGQLCQTQRLIASPVCSYVNDTIIPVTAANPHAYGNLTANNIDDSYQDYAVIMCVSLALVANSQWCSPLWLLPAVALNILGSTYFVEDFPFCTFATLPLQEMPYALSRPLADLFPAAPRLCMDDNMNAFWPPLYESNGTQFFMPCDILAMQACEDDSNNIYADIQVNRVLYVMIFILTVLLSVLLIKELVGVLRKHRVCNTGYLWFKRAQSFRRKVLHTLARLCRAQVEDSAELERWEYPTRMMLGATVSLVVLYCVVAYSIRLLWPVLDGFGIDSLLYIFLVSGLLASIAAIAAVWRTMRQFRQTAVALVKDGGVQLSSENHSARLVIQSLPRAQISAASSFVGTWIGRLVFATYLCWLFLFVIIAVIVVPFLRALLFQLGFLIWPKLVQLVIPYVQYYCFVGSEPLRIRHPRIFFLSDLVNTTISGLAGVITAALTLAKGLIFLIINMYFIDRSILPHPWEMQDAGFSQYCAVMAAYKYKISTIRVEEPAQLGI